MDNIIISPGKYIQGRGALGNLAHYAGQHSLVIADEFVLGLTRDTVASSFDKEDIKVTFELFGGECCKQEIQRLAAIAEACGSEMVVGIGGGKALDTAKAVAYYLHQPVVIAPTIASTDAPCSALSVLYTEEGIFEEYLLLRQNPDMVLMDTEIIANAPTRLLVAGMGDALATYFEARAVSNSHKGNLAGGLPTKAAMALAKLCFDTLIEKGQLAKLAAEANVVTSALEDVVEANTYLSGVGFESGGLAAAHAIHNGLTILEECHGQYHGEKVAFGTITQLVLENAPSTEIQQVIDFCRQVGLPTNLAELGVSQFDKAKLYEVAVLATAQGETIHNMPFAVDADSVLAAMLVADQLGS